jgi:serine/threonine protein kinase
MPGARSGRRLPRPLLQRRPPPSLATGPDLLPAGELLLVRHHHALYDLCPSIVLVSIVAVLWSDHLRLLVELSFVCPSPLPPDIDESCVVLLVAALDKEERCILELLEMLSKPYCPPCVLPFAHVQMSPRAAFLIRPFVADNLYDRLHTRPFLSPIEKRWYAYVLLRALEQLHSRQVCHGDLKSENVLLTSSGWVLLADLASYKVVLCRDKD